MRRRSDHLEQVQCKLDKLSEALAHIESLNERRFNDIMTVLDDLTAQVAANTTVSESAVTLINGLKAQIDALIAAGNDDPALQALSDQLATSDAALAAAVSANTPAPAEPTPDQPAS